MVKPMVKLVLNFQQGSFTKGFDATLEISDRDHIFTIQGQLPPQPTLPKIYEDWQDSFNKKDGFVEEEVRKKAKSVQENLNTWLNSQLFSPIKSKLAEIFTSSEEVRLLVQAENYQLWRLPWEQWDFFAHHPQLEIALSSPVSKSIKRCTLNQPKTKIRILCIQGNTKGINTAIDIEALQTFCQDKADIKLCQQPSRKELSICLRDKKGWDIIFFAGHSSTDSQQTGRIDINERESLTIPDLKYALRAAIALGLKLAIFNSCDGLGLARNLADLQIPSVVVMREPVPDQVAQVFVEEFLKQFANNESLYSSVRQARESLKNLENQYPCASWLPVICQNPAEDAIAYQELLSGLNTETTWEGACRTLLTLDGIKRLELNMLTKKKGLEIDDIYVPPNLDLVKRFKNNHPQELSQEEQEQQKRENQFPDTYQQDNFFKQVIERGRSIYSQGQRLAIIGEAGIGKSLFLQRLGEWIVWESNTTNQVVIWVSLADLKREQSLEDYLQQNWLEYANQQVKIPATNREDLRALFASGQVFLLLDGADEMPVRLGNPLEVIVRQIATSSVVSQARILLTCRVNVWEANQNVLQNFDVYRHLDFSDRAKYGRTINQVEAFIDRWFNGSEQQRKIGLNLRQELEQESKKKIKDLTKNPLRLSLLCLVWEEQGRLPDTKTELYQQFVEEIYKWKQQQLQLDQAKIESLNKKLAELAIKTLDQSRQNLVKWVMSRWEMSRAEKSNIPLAEAMINWSGNSLLLSRMGPQESPFRIPYFIAWSILGNNDDFAIAEKLGWLNQVGVSAINPQERIYAFLHPTFHEYFAAQAITFEQWNYFLDHHNFFTNHPAYGTYRIFEQQWREVILFWFGRPTEEGTYDKVCKESFLQELWEFRDKCKGFYSLQAQLLAATALGEFRNCSDEIAEKIIPEVIQYSFVIEKSNFLPYDTVIRRAYFALLQTNSSKVKDYLVELLSRIPLNHRVTRYNIANVISEFYPGNEEAINTYLNLIQIDRDDFHQIKIQFYAKEKLAEVAHGNRKVINYLWQQFYRNHNQDNREINAVILGIIASGKIDVVKKAIETLIEILFTCSEESYSYSFYEYFEEIALENIDINVTQKVIEYLTYLLETKEYKNLPWLTPMQRQNLPWYEQSDDSEDCKSIAFTRYQQIRLCAAQALFKINPNNLDAVITLADLIKIEEYYPFVNDKDADFIRSSAVEILEKFGVDNQVVISVLSEGIVNIENDNTLRITADTLGKVAADTNNECAIEALIARIHKTEDLWRGKQLAEILSKIQPSHPEAIRFLHELILSTLKNNQRDEPLILTAAKALGTISPNNTQAINTLMELQQLIQDRLDDLLNQLGISYKNMAASTINEILEGNCNIYEDTFTRNNLLRDISKTYIILRRSIKNLGELTYSNAKVIDRLTNLLRYPGEQVQYEAASSLAKIDPGNSKALDTLIEIHRNAKSEFLRDQAGGIFQFLANQVREISDSQRRETLINAIIEIMETHPHPYQRYHTAQALTEVLPGNDQVVSTLLDLLNNYPEVYQEKIINTLKETLRGKQFQQIVIASKNPLEDADKNHNVNLFKNYHELLCFCAENLSYPDFFRAFHNQSDFEHLKPSMLLGRAITLIIYFQAKVSFYVSQVREHPYYLIFDILQLLFIGIKWSLKLAALTLFTPLFMIFLLIFGIFNIKLWSQLFYILKSFIVFLSGLIVSLFFFLYGLLYALWILIIRFLDRWRN